MLGTIAIACVLWSKPKFCYLSDNLKRAVGTAEQLRNQKREEKEDLVAELRNWVKLNFIESKLT